MTKVCISGYYGFDNFGDETILKILCENIKSFKNSEKIDITVFSSNPEKTSALYGVKSVRNFDVKSVFKTIKNCDCLISGGGSLLQDVTSKKSLIYYLSLIIFASLLKKKIIIFAQGIGPINDKILSALTVFFLKKATFVTVRDNNGYKLLKKNGVECSLCSDPVWNLQLPSFNKTGTEKILGVQLRTFPSLTDEFLSRLAKFVSLQYKNATIKILSLQNTLDLPACEKFQTMLKEINPRINSEIIRNTSNDKAINDICTCDELIAMRYHACLVAVKSGVKLLPVSYDIKVENLAKEFDLPYITLDNPDWDEDTLTKYVSSEKSYDKSRINALKYDFREIEKIIN